MGLALCFVMSFLFIKMKMMAKTNKLNAHLPIIIKDAIIKMHAEQISLPQKIFINW